MDRLAFPFEIRALADSGEVEGLVSAFGGVDHYGDTVAPNAYAKSLASLAATGRKLPMLFGHDLKRPIGAWADLKETAAGLYGKGKITLACRDGAEAHALAKDGAIGGISIGFTIPDGGAVSNGAAGC
jgi:HK97 family phage prohead protease